MSEVDAAERPRPSRPPYHHRRWPPALAFIAIGAIYLILSDRLVPGPPWLVMAAVLACLAPLWVASRRGRHDLVRALALAATAAVTLALVASTALLVAALARGRAGALVLLSDAALLWLTNILVFALWYWELDGGGPVQRHRTGCPSTDFVFPQMTREDAACRGWCPAFLDYLFLAFNTSTAFSPTDTMVLARRAKALLMVQSLISLVTVAVIAARAINTIGS